MSFHPGITARQSGGAQGQVDRQAELQRLYEADGHIANAERHVTGQLCLIARLRNDGHDTAAAEQMLKAFEVTLKTLRQHREVIVRIIEQIDQRPA